MDLRAPARLVARFSPPCEAEESNWGLWRNKPSFQPGLFRVRHSGLFNRPGWITGAAVCCALLLAAIGLSRSACAQAPTIEQQGVVGGSAVANAAPGSMNSLLGQMPGSAGGLQGVQPGRDDMLLGRLGTSVPRVPTSVTTPGGVYQGPPAGVSAAAPQPAPLPRAPFYGTLELPREEADEGPPNGLTLDQAIDLLIQRNLDLHAKYLEIPQARADVLTASLRANPIFYADTQLVPYGSDSIRQPGGPTQYDVNVSMPFDLSHKRRARTNYATRALQVMEAQYQDEVRLAIQNVYNAYVDVLAAREVVRYVETSVRGLDLYLRTYEELFKQHTATSADVDAARSDRDIAAAGLDDSQQFLLQKKRTLGALLFLSPEESEQLDLRGTIGDRGPPPPSREELYQIALSSRPDLAAFQLGIVAAEANVKLQLANRFADAYLLYQPYTFQNNAPYRTESATSWAWGITVPMPVFNRNQGNIERAKINVDQSGVQFRAQQRRVITEVQQAVAEYEVSGRIVRTLRLQVLRRLEGATQARERLFVEGEATKFAFLDAQRKYNDTAKSYLDSAVRHRRSMLTLNTVVGQRIMP
jgi:outer membrane protein, heavy metal efflux system